MGLWFSKRKKVWKPERELRTLVLGLDNSGKSSMYRRAVVMVLHFANIMYLIMMLYT